MAFNRVLAIAVALAIPSCRAGHDAQQLVKKDPPAVYAAFADTYSLGAMGGASQYSDLWHGGMQNFVEKTSDTTLDVVTKFDGKTATAVHFIFTPQDGGKTTLVEADVTVDQAVMHNALAGSAKANLGNLPESAFVAGMQRMLAKYARRIEEGAPLNDPGQGWMTGKVDPPPEFYEGMPEEQLAEIRRVQEEERQDAVTAPMVDPDAAARNYLNSQGSAR